MPGSYSHVGEYAAGIQLFKLYGLLKGKKV